MTPWKLKALTPSSGWHIGMQRLHARSKLPPRPQATTFRHSSCLSYDALWLEAKLACCPDAADLCPVRDALLNAAHNRQGADGYAA